jgi:hypothetical protein
MALVAELVILSTLAQPMRVVKEAARAKPSRVLVRKTEVMEIPSR